mmetsp:Transcript_7218/g.6492  ORF Transcript_7218/g.6492 Transcript_7218/m.6492 type:complete len:144 (-) Transcript_7218:1268-1699(-)
MFRTYEAKRITKLALMDKDSLEFLCEIYPFWADCMRKKSPAYRVIRRVQKRFIKRRKLATTIKLDDDFQTDRSFKTLPEKQETTSKKGDDELGSIINNDEAKKSMDTSQVELLKNQTETNDTQKVVKRPAYRENSISKKHRQS